MKIYIYQIYFPTSDKCYIGQTVCLEKRMKVHLKSGHLICRALWKYDDWQISILHTCKSRDEANRIEIEEIRNYNSINPNGYNILRGGEGGDTFANNPNKEKIRKKLSKAMQGKHHTEEAKIKVSKSLIGNQRSKGKKLGNQFVKGKHWTWSKESKEKAKGNQNAKGKHWKWPEKSKEKLQGNKNCSHSTESEIKRLKTRIKKLEQ